jgi:hypothetical protein
VPEEPREPGMRRRGTLSSLEVREVGPQPTKEGRDKYEVDRGHGVAKALHTVLRNADIEDKAQGMSLVQTLSIYFEGANFQ